jgi:hypothetical protein
MSRPRTERRSLGSAISSDVSLAEVSALAALAAQRSVEALQASAQRGRRVNTRPKADASKRARSRSVEVNDKENELSNSQLVATAFLPQFPRRSSLVFDLNEEVDAKSGLVAGSLPQGPEAIAEPAGPLQATLQALGRRSFGSELQETAPPTQQSPPKEPIEVPEPKPRRRSRSADRTEATPAVGSKAPAGLAKKLLTGTSSKRKDQAAPLRASPLTPPLDFAPLTLPSPPRGLSPLRGTAFESEPDDAARLESWLGETVAAASTDNEVLREVENSNTEHTLTGSIESKNAADVLASLLQKQKPLPKQKQKAAPTEKPKQQPKPAGNRKSLPSGKQLEDAAKTKHSPRLEPVVEKNKKEQASSSTFTSRTSSGGATSSRKLLSEPTPPTSPTETRNALIAARERAAAAQQRLEAAEAARRLEEARSRDARRSLLAAQLEIEELERSAGAIDDSELQAPSTRRRNNSMVATPRPDFEACSPQIPEGFTFAPGTPPSELEETVRMKRAADSSGTAQPSTFRRRLSSKTSAHLFFSPPLDERDTATPSQAPRRSIMAVENSNQAIVETPPQPSKGTSQTVARKSKGNLEKPILVKASQQEAEQPHVQQVKHKDPNKNTTHKTLTEPQDKTQPKKVPKAKTDIEPKASSEAKPTTKPKEKKLPKEPKEAKQMTEPKKPKGPKQPKVANRKETKASAAALEAPLQPSGSKRASISSSTGPSAKASGPEAKKRRISHSSVKELQATAMR